ncbi:MAG TPA: asparagine synthase-related protein [bacterium]
MIIDILGIFDPMRRPVSLSPIRSWLLASRKLIGDDSGCEEHEFVFADLQLAFTSRSDPREYCADDDDLMALAIGEVYLNAAGRGKSNAGRVKLKPADLLSLYRATGKNFSDHIKGDFQLIILNKPRREFIILNSRFGISPCYFSWQDKKLLFSNNLAMIAKFTGNDQDIDTLALAEYAIFGYPLGDLTFFKKIKRLPPAARLQVSEDSFTSGIYWNCASMLHQPLYSHAEAGEIGGKLFKDTVNACAAEPGKICLSLTGGFDSRTILAVLDKDPQDLLCYSFGIDQSLNVKIPRQMCAENGLQFLPVYLEHDYERAFGDCAGQAVFFSDCLSSIERANYPYAFRKLRPFSGVVISGIFGSELLRTFQNVALGYMVNDNYVLINFARDKKEAINAVIDRARAGSYFHADNFKNRDELVEHIHQTCLADYPTQDDQERFYLFMLKEGMRKYFGAEVHMERIYAENRFPFLDDEFVEFIFKSPFAGVYTDPLKPSIRQRFESQHFYARLIKRYRPQLLKFTTDHGYPPRYLLSRAALFKMMPGLALKKARRIFTNYREFKIEEWSADFYRGHISPSDLVLPMFSNRLKADYTDNKWSGDRMKFAQAVSLSLYLKILNSL